MILLLRLCSSEEIITQHFDLPAPESRDERHVVDGFRVLPGDGFDALACAEDTWVHFQRFGDFIADGFEFCDAGVEVRVFFPPWCFGEAREVCLSDCVGRLDGLDCALGSGIAHGAREAPNVMDLGACFWRLSGEFEEDFVAGDAEGSAVQLRGDGVAPSDEFAEPGEFTS